MQYRIRSISFRSYALAFAFAAFSVFAFAPNSFAFFNEARFAANGNTAFQQSAGAQFASTTFDVARK